jgi:hypothetical protein
MIQHGITCYNYKRNILETNQNYSALQLDRAQCRLSPIMRLGKSQDRHFTTESFVSFGKLSRERFNEINLELF